MAQRVLYAYGRRRTREVPDVLWLQPCDNCSKIVSSLVLGLSQLCAEKLVCLRLISDP